MMVVFAGAFAGALHVVSGPDHLAALGPSASRAPGKAIRLGALWGLGHGAGVLIAAMLGRALDGVFALDRLSAWAEFSVGFVLVALGIRTLIKACSARSHDVETPRGRGAFSIGLLHGAAGAHHLFMVLPALFLAPTDAALYLLAYLGSAVLAMAVAGALVALGLRGRSERAHRVAHGVAGALALAVGVVWIGTAASPIG